MRFIKRRFGMALAAVAVLAALAGAGGAAAVLFIQSPLFQYLPSAGSLSPFLVGYYDGREGSDSLAEDGCDEREDQCVDDIAEDVDDVEPVLYLVNPTPKPLTAYIAVFDNAENPLGCEKLTLTPNDVTDFLISKYGEDRLGAVKVVTFDARQPGVILQAGVKGWLTHYVEEDNGNDWGYMRESILQEVPADVLMKDLDGDRKPDELSLIVNFCDTFQTTTGTRGQADVPGQ